MGERQPATEWFAAFHAELARVLHERLTPPDGAAAARLPPSFPRSTVAYRDALRAAGSVARGERALELLCYLALQALPRHSRVYAHAYLGGSAHDADEMRAVHRAVLDHEEAQQAVGGRRMSLKEQRRRSLQTDVDARMSKVDELCIDSSSDEDDEGEAGEEGADSRTPAARHSPAPVRADASGERAAHGAADGVADGATGAERRERPGVRAVPRLRLDLLRDRKQS